MNVTIIGSGNMARGIGSRLVAGGNSIRILDRDKEKANVLAGELRAQDGAEVTTGSFGDTIESDVVVLAVPYDAVESIAEQYGSGLSGKVVIDITNPVDWASFDGLVTPPDSSAAEESTGSSPKQRSSRHSTLRLPARSSVGRWPDSRSTCSSPPTIPTRSGKSPGSSRPGGYGL